MIKTAEKLRASIANAERSGAGRPYPLALRREVVAYVDERQQQGLGRVAAAREIGVSAFSVARWTAALGASPAGLDASTAALGAARSIGFRRVVLAEPIEIRAPSEPSRFVLHGPGGLRVDGLDVASLAELWRRLL